MCLGIPKTHAHQNNRTADASVVLQQCAELVAEVRERHQKGIFADEAGRETVFDALIGAEPQRSTIGFVDEAFALVFGGTDTTVTTMTFAIWCILKNPDIEKKLLDELNTVEMNSDGLMEYPGLINLPYLVRLKKPRRGA